MKRVLAIAAAPLFLLAACGSSDDSSSTPSTVTKTVTSSSSSVSHSSATSQESSSAGASPSSESPQQAMPNPVDLLRKIPGCVVQDNAKMGTSDMAGNLFATCRHGGAKDDGSGPENSVDITIRTNAMTPQALGQLQPDDNLQLAYGPTWLAEVRPVFGNGTYSMTADKVASLLGGKVVPAGGVDTSE